LKSQPRREDAKGLEPEKEEKEKFKEKALGL
jgi:hypothetical protein